ncbi:MAG: rod shape-determining protein MreD [Gammaproteobacteria bacterium]|nr:rod shape-determining protein MreD [Gammaproteobacteria bacterium]
MHSQPKHRSGIILISFAVAFALTMLPLPDWSEVGRPEWVSLVVIYWCLALPERVGVGIAWMAGLLLDVIHGAILGQYALALALLAYFTLHFYQRIRIYRIWQQATVVFMLILSEQLIIIWIKGTIGQAPESRLYWVPSLTTALLWPWIYHILRDLRRKFRVN